MHVPEILHAFLSISESLFPIIDVHGELLDTKFYFWARLSEPFDFCLDITELLLCRLEVTCRLLTVLVIGPQNLRAHCLSLELRAHSTT
jgi:hypothetical protein